MNTLFSKTYCIELAKKIYGSNYTFASCEEWNSLLGFGNEDGVLYAGFWTYAGSESLSFFDKDGGSIVVVIGQAPLYTPGFSFAIFKAIEEGGAVYNNFSGYKITLTPPLP